MFSFCLNSARTVRLRRKAGLVLSMLALATGLQAQQAFTEKAALHGINLDGPKDGGFAFGDLNNDGYLDLIVNTFKDHPNYRSKMYFSSGPPSWNFTEVTNSNATGINDPQDGDNVMERCVVIADFNNDGYNDFVRNTAKRLELYFNKGPAPVDGDVPWSFGDAGQQPNFELWTPSTGDGSPPPTAIPYGMNTEGVGAWDYDNDGDLDLFIENHNWGIDIYENTGFATGNFVHVTPNGSGKGLPQVAIDGDYASVTDVNDDGYIDGIARKRRQEDFFMNQGNGTFLPVGGFNQDADNSNKGAVSLYDYDNDGDYDLVWTEKDFNQLWIQDGIGSGNYSTTNEPWASSGLTDPYSDGDNKGIDGAASGDVDNDGDIDLFFADDSGPSYLFINQTIETGSLGFVRNNLGIDVDEDAEGCVFVDFDQDGDLDLYININGDDNQLWVNNLNTLPKGDDYLFVAVVEDRDAAGNPYGHPNRDATGANVRLLDCDGNVVSGTREVNGGNGHGTQDPARVHFGLPFGPNAQYVVDVRYPYYAGTRLMTTDLIKPADLAGGTYIMTVSTTSSASIHNTAPVALDDTLILCAGQTTITLNVTHNDSDPDGDTLNVFTLVSPPANGTATVMGPDGTVVYTYTGTGPFPGDSFRYRLNDRPSCAFIGKWDEASVVINPSPALVVTSGSAACTDDLLSYDRDVTVSGGAGSGYTLDAGPYTVLDLGGGQFRVQGIPAGSTATVSAGDALGCETTGVILAAETCPCPTVPAPTGAQGDTICAGASASAIAVADPGADHVVEWFAAASGGTVLHTGTSFTPPAAGTYHAQIKNTVNGCVSDSRLAVALVENAPMVASVVPGSQACESTLTWTVDIAASGGIGGPYNLTLSAGAAVDNGDGTWTIGGIPEGTGSTVTVRDGLGCAASTLNLPLLSLPVVCNDPPVAVDDAVSTDEDTPVDIDVLANDNDPDAALIPGNVSLLSGTANGSLTLNPDGSFTYTPNSNWHGTDGFSYTYCDADGACDTAAVVITVLDVNDPPIAINDSGSTPEDTPVTTSVMGNDSDPDGSLLAASVTVLSPPANGSTTVNPDGSITYTPDPDFTGTDSYSYQVCDDDGACASATVTINVTPVNDPPVAVDDTDNTTEDTPVTTDVLANDSDVDGTLVPGSVVVLSPPANGSVTVNADGSITYTPDADFYGTDTYTYQVCDDAGLCDNATVTISVGDVNDPPVAVNDNASTPEDTPVNIPVLGNDSDPDGTLDPGSVSIVSPPSNGTVTVNPDGTITYTPNPDYHGPDSFTYTVCDDDGACDEATVTISVGDVNDPPVAVDDAASTPEDTPVTVDILLNDSDPDGSLDPATVTLVSGPSNGTAYPDPITGELVYTPNPNWNGVDVIVYSVCDDDGACDQATVTITVLDVNDPPVAVNDNASTPEDTPVNIPVLGNDNDPDGTLDPSSVSIVSPPSNGTVTVNPDGTVTYTPNPDYHGPDSFTYQVCDDDGACDEATVTISVGDVNDPPIAVDDNASTPEDTPVDIAVMTNDSDPDGTLDPGSVSIVSPPANGTVTVNPDGTITYTPNANYHGPDSFSYDVCDDDGACDQATVSITVLDVNDPPMANNDVAFTPEDTPVDIAILGNDNDPDGTLDPGSVSIVSPPANGTVTVHPDGTVTYTPNSDYFGPDSFTYEVCDDDGACDQATVTINVGDENDPPVAVDDAVTTPEDTSVDIAVMTNDSDPDGTLNPSSVVVITPPSHGTATVNPDGTITYTPNANYNGPDSFTYQVCDDDGSCDVATVSITVLDVNDPPIAVDDNASTPEDTPVDITVLGNDNDPDGTLDPGSVSIVSPPANGTVTVNPDGTITYTPNPDYHGPDSFIYSVCDDDGACDEATVTISVGDVNDPPIAVDDNASTPEDTPVTVPVLANDSDVDGTLDPSSVVVVTPPSHGSAVVNPDGTITYTPNPGYNGPDSFTYQVCDDDGACAIATVTIGVADVNDPPFAMDDAAVTDEDTPVDITVLANDNDTDGTLDPSSVVIVTGPTNGTVTVHPDGSVTYTPDADWNGVDVFTYEVCDDDGACDQATVTVTVNDVNDPPIAVDDALTMPEDSTAIVVVLGNDSDPDGTLDPSSLTIVSPPANGSVTVNPDGTVSYTPDPNWNGVDSFSYDVCDDDGACDQATVVITVEPVNDPPVAIDDVASGLEDHPITADVLANDYDIDGNLVPGSVVIITDPSNGTATVHADGSISFFPGPDWNGTDSLQYLVCDDGTPLPSLCDSAWLVLHVGDVNDPPIAVIDFAGGDEDSTITITVLDNDYDTDGYLDTASVHIVSPPANGTATVNADGSISYTPGADWNGTDTLIYEVCDDDGACDTALVVIGIGAVVDPPLAVDDLVTTPEDSSITVVVAANDSDPDGDLDPGSTVIVSPPANGTATVNPDGSITYTPDPDWFGTDTLSYQICDATGLCDTALVIITVTPVADPPFAVDDYATTNEDVPVTVDVLANDTDVEGDIDPGSVTVLVDPNHGSASVNPDGSITYTPDAGFFGTDSLLYLVCDSTGLCDSAWVFITIAEVPNPLIAVDDFEATHEDIPVTVDVLGNDIEGDYPIDPATLAILSGPGHGTLSVSPGTGEVTYTPSADWCGTDSFVYRICDTWGYCDTAVVFIIVECVDLVANDDNATTDAGDDVVIDILANDSPNADPDCIEFIGTPSHGTAVINPDGTVTYTPDIGFVGEDCWPYRVCDTLGVEFDDAMICVTVELIDLTIPEVFTPNGDGFNETFEIVGIEQYPNNRIMIFNRWENLVFQADGYRSEWDGVWMKNGKVLPDGTYYYVLELDPKNPNGKVFKGFVQIQR